MMSSNFFSFRPQEKTAVLSCAAALVLLAVIFYPVHEGRIKSPGSLRIISREGTELRRFRTVKEGSFAEWISIDRYPAQLIKYVIAAEDKRFYYHPGFDVIAVIRSAAVNIFSRRILTGGSTITQQLVRIAWRGELPRNRFIRKGIEIILAVRLEFWFTKDQILESYLNRVPLKYNQTGFPSAAKKIFERDLAFLSKEELAALTVLVRRNETSRAVFAGRYDRLWKKIEPQASPRGKDDIMEKIFSIKNPANVNTADSTRHFEEWIKSSNSVIGGELRTAISADLTSAITEIVNNELAFLERYDVENAAVVVLSLEDENFFQLTAMVGSRDFSSGTDGQVNGAVSVREAGSSLKPFIYALAMDRKGYLPSTIVEDRELGFQNEKGETYMPRNYDLAFWGNITIREALGASRNITAVDMISRVGVSEFYTLLKNAGYQHLDRPPEYYGYGLALGAGGTSLIQLTAMYGAIANGGVIKPVLVGLDGAGRHISTGNEFRVMSEKSSIYITDILSDRAVRRRANGSRNFLDFPFDAAVKTGTSKDYRDSWTVGFINGYAVGVWAGNFSGKTMKRVSGSWGAGRIFHQVLRLLAEKKKPVFSYPDGYRRIDLCRHSGLLPSAGCPRYSELLHLSDIPEKKCFHGGESAGAMVASGYPRILSPSPGEQFIIDTLKPLSQQPVPLRISSAGQADGQKNTFYYQIDSGVRKKIRSEVNTAAVLNRGDHIIILFREDEPVASVSFSVR